MLLLPLICTFLGANNRQIIASHVNLCDLRPGDDITVAYDRLVGSVCSPSRLTTAGTQVQNGIVNTGAGTIQILALLTLPGFPVRKQIAFGKIDSSDWVQFSIETTSPIHILSILAFFLYISDVYVVASDVFPLSRVKSEET